jgi:hypothetical protein
VYGAASRSANSFRAIAKSKFPSVIGLDLRPIALLADGHLCRPRSVCPEYSTRIVLHVARHRQKKIRYRDAFGPEGMFLVQVGYARVVNWKVYITQRGERPNDLAAYISQLSRAAASPVIETLVSGALGQAEESGVSAGPPSTLPFGPKREPWHGQSQVASAWFQRTRQPMCVQTADIFFTRPRSSR